MTRPDIAILAFDFRGTGVIRNALHIAQASRDRGFNVQFLVVRNEGPFAHAANEFPVESLGRTASFGRLVETPLAIGPLRRALMRLKPRILFSAGNHIHPIVEPALSGVDRQTAIVMRASNDMEHHRSARSSALSRVARRLIIPHAARAMFASADKIVAVSEELASQVRTYLPDKYQSVIAIENGLDIEDIEAKSRELFFHPWLAPGQPPVIVGMGRLVRQKNFAMLIEAFARLRRQQMARLFILGTGPELQALQASAYFQGVHDDIAFLGYVANPFSLLRRASLFALSSSWEGFSNALLEALACGCPVVATQCQTGTREILDGGRVGPLVAIDSVPDLCAAMISRLAAPRESGLLVAQARKFNLADAMRRYVTLFQSMMDGHVRGSDQQITAPRRAA